MAIDLAYVDGVLQIANLFLSIVAGMVAISLFKASKEDKLLAAWKPLIIVLILFAGEMVLGALWAFNIYRTPHLTHVGASVIMLLVIYALNKQLVISR